MGMRNLKERNLRIVGMAETGMTQTVIAKRFRVSHSLIGIILKKHEVEQVTKAKRREIRKRMLEADDLERLWPTEQLLCAIGPMLMTWNALDRYFKKIGRTEISLREMMDMIVPEEDPRFGPDLIRAVDFVGKYGFWSVVHQLNSMDLGAKCNTEWRRRLDLLCKRWKITGEFPYHGEPE